MNHHFKSIRFSGLAAGPRIIITGAVHGNETCGTKAIDRVLDDIENKRVNILAGTVTFVPITNPLAYAKNERNGDRNLNRNLSPSIAPKDFEDHIANWLCPLFAEHDILLDLHSTRAKNPAFAMLGPVNNDGPLQPFKHFDKERALAKQLGVSRFVDGWLSTYATGVERRIARAKSLGGSTATLDTDPRYGIGTTEYMRSTGGYAITLECGQHDDPQSPEVGYRAIHNALAFLGVSDGAMNQRVSASLLTPTESLSLYDVIDRHHVDDTFSREWASFNSLTKGELIGTRADGSKVLAPNDGYIVFPDAKSLPAHEWFYLARAAS
jgi:predicted deacylase